MYFGNTGDTNNGQDFVGGLKLLKTFLKGTTALMRFREHLSVVEKFGENKGAVVGWSVIGKLAKVGPTLETASAPVNNPPVSKGSVTMTEYMNSIPFTYKLETLSELQIKNIFQDTLGQNAGESLDEAAKIGAYDATNVIAVPGGAGFDSLTDVTITTNGTPAGKNNAPFTKAHLRRILTYMKQNNYPTKDGVYYCIGTPASLEPLKAELDSIFQRTESGFGRIVNGAIGKIDNCVVIEQTNVIEKPWTNGKSGEIYVFGDENGIEVIGVPEEIRETVPGDLGRNKQIGWYYIGGFASMRPDRVVKWSSLKS